MSYIKRWSTGALGNEFPDHSESGNSNTKGLDAQNLPGVEAYIEEDEVVASTDNRPLKNLVDNDLLLDTTISDVASEVDRGILKGRYNNFDLEIKGVETVYNPETSSEKMEITPIRIKSGSFLINGKVTRVGQQKIVYFFRKDDVNSILFPKYDEHLSEISFDIIDENYFSDSLETSFGRYEPVYAPVSEGLPDNFTSFFIRIQNVDSKHSGSNIVDTTFTTFNVYRDWDDIVPLLPDTNIVTSEVIDFENERNYSQFSEGYSLNSGGVASTQVSAVSVTKDITINDKLFTQSDFIDDETLLETDGQFFYNISLLGKEDFFDRRTDVQDFYIDNQENIYFINRNIDPAKPKYVFYKPYSTDRIQLELQLSNDDRIISAIKVIRDRYMIFIGTKGTINSGYIKYWDMRTDFASTNPVSFTLDTAGQSIRDVYEWNTLLFIAGDTKVWYSALSLDVITDLSTAIFNEIDLNQFVLNSSNQAVVKRVTKLCKIEATYFSDRVESYPHNEIINFLKNPSFEEGAINNVPNNWTITSQDGNFHVQQGSALFGSMHVNLIKTGAAISFGGEQIVDIRDYSDKNFLISYYVAAASIADLKITATILDINNSILESSERIPTLLGDSVYRRLWHKIDISTQFRNQAKKIKISFTTETSNVPISIDCAQLEINNYDPGLNQLLCFPSSFTENLEYLLIGFEKLDSNLSDPPFALIDDTDKFNIKYSNNILGNIHSINDIIKISNNNYYVIDDKKIYSLIFSNERSQYDRVTVEVISDDSRFDFSNSIEKFESLSYYKNRVYFGGTVRNKIVFGMYDNIVDSDMNNLDHTIVLSDETTGTNESLLDLLGGYKFIKNSVSRNNRASIEFNLYEDCTEEANVDYSSVGKYIPESTYGVKVTIDLVQDSIIRIVAPEKNNGPWTIQEIWNDIYTYVLNNYGTSSNIKWVNPSGSELSQIEWKNIAASSSKYDGLYSFGGIRNSAVSKGNVHNIKQFNESLYIAKDDVIVKLTEDQNKIKNVSGEYESYEPQLLSEASCDVFLFKKVKNEIISFNEDPNSRLWTDISIESGYNILPGSLIVKTNQYTNLSYNNLDYFIDYDNNKIMTSSGENYLLNSNFSIGVENSPPLNWSSFGSGAILKVKHDTIEFDSACQLYSTISNSESILYQYVIIPMLNVGQTFNFSVYAIANKRDTTYSIKLTECTNLDKEIFDNSQPSTSTNFTVTDNNDTWNRYDVTHQISNVDSTILRVEIHTVHIFDFRVSNAQLEKNIISSPYRIENRISKINPDSTVYLDYTMFKKLENIVGNLEYTIDTSSRKLKLLNHTTSEAIYISYKYNKIFNAFDFGNSIPKTQVTTNNEDYYLYLPEGRIWAVNQSFSILSLEDDKIHVGYKYHYPRIDQIKIRNTPDKYGNYLYLVKGTVDPFNPKKPNDIGIGDGFNEQRYFNEVDKSQIVDNLNNEVLYEINVTSYNYNKNDIYDRRIYVDSRLNSNYNISLVPETIAYFPFAKDFNSTNGLRPLSEITTSKIIPIIKYYSILQNEEIGAWSKNYQIALRTKIAKSGVANSIYVDILNGNDYSTTDGFTASTALKTVKEALARLYFNDENDRRNNIVVINSGVEISENISINKDFQVSLFAETFCYFSGAIQIISDTTIQGFWFKNTELYPFNVLKLYYCTFENASISCASPRDMIISNCEFKYCKNSIIRVNEILSPSPFIHPYSRNPLRDDSIAAFPDSIATSENESISPNDTYIYNQTTFGAYVLSYCLIYKNTDSLIEFDPIDDFSASFKFSYCTIVENQNLFDTDRDDISITYENSILYKNLEERAVSGATSRVFDSASNLIFNRCFIDFSRDVNEQINFRDASLVGGETCLGWPSDLNPNFVDITLDDYHLQSIPRGSLNDSICLNASITSIDLGCYNEVREQTEKNVPKKLRNYVAFIDEAIIYPMSINSEKITVTLEFKPYGSVSSVGIIIDTRSDIDENDYIVLAYNNNDIDDSSLFNNQIDPSAPYRFKVIVKNKEAEYVVCSPIEINSEELFNQWHKISFTINYEKIFNIKPDSLEYDKQQNIITLYHNDEVSIESFIKYDLNRYKNGEYIVDFNNETNKWNFNDICQYVTIGAAFDNSYRLPGYYSELRIDNKYTDRKQFELWNAKTVPFNDPLSYINQAPIVRAIENKYLNEYWPLIDKYGISAKGNTLKYSEKIISVDKGNTTWFLGKGFNNLIIDSGFTNANSNTAFIKATNLMSFSTSISFVSNWTIITTGSRKSTDNTLKTLSTISTISAGKAAFVAFMDNLFNYDTMLGWRFNNLGFVEIFSKDCIASDITVNFGSDFTKLGFIVASNIGTKPVSVWSSDITNVSNINNTVYFTYDEQYCLNSSKSLVIHKANTSSQITITNSSVIGVEPNKLYTLSLYLYFDGQLDLQNINCSIENVFTNSVFSTVEKRENNLYILTINFEHTTSSVGPISLTFKDTSQFIDLFIDSIQINKGLKKPYIDTLYSKNGSVVVNKNLLNREKGVIYFKFKPLYDFKDSLGYDENDSLPALDSNSYPRILFETLGIDETGSHLEENIRVMNYYDALKNRGIVEFTINSYKWKLEVSERFWYQWHSIAIIYDFSTNRFVFRFDYFNKVIDAAITREYDQYSDLYFGTGSVNGSRSYSDYSSDILIKDIIILNQPLSDVEMQAWIQSFEFYNSQQIVNSIENLEKLQSSSDQLSSNDVLTLLNATQNDIDNIQSTQGAQQSNIGQLISDLNIAESNISSLQTTIGNSSSGLIKEIDDTQTRTTSLESQLSSINGDIVNLNSDISNEILNRDLAVDGLKSELTNQGVTSGASIVGLNSSLTEFSAVTVEAALLELAGVGRTTETVKNNASDIEDIETRIIDIDDSISDINSNLVDLNAFTNTTTGFPNTLSSNILNQGASLIGVHDATNKITALTVEAALVELAENINTIEIDVSSLQGSVGDIQDSVDDVNERIDNLVFAMPIETQNPPLDSPAVGTTRFHVTSKTLFIYDGASWVGTVLS